MNYKDKARAFHRAVSSYDESAVLSMVRESYIQHNPHVPTGRAAFVALLPKLKDHGSKIKNIRMLQDGAYVLMHHLWENATPFGADAMAAFHIVRFDSQKFIAEHWSAMMPAAPRNPSGRSLVDGATEIQDWDRTEENKARVAELFEQLARTSQDKMRHILLDFFHPEFQQHHPAVADGVNGLIVAMQSGRPNIRYRKHHRVFGEGNFVLSVSEGLQSGRSTALYDLLRFERGKIAEHWNIYQDIPTEGLMNHNTMFGFGRNSPPEKVSV